ncbi:FAD/NAD(P)-binding protein [Streptomyces sp. NBC_01142]|uniref:FAD/NAD(P)-binding protein n=1 Tax=Streptomyces sp. NBC_01142 TaxID=2975865 RepID=UPI00224E9F9D|nr:FAD/NAD(P)-binding protein [Streptomyces sp. NBC_01142]MCX4824767.1 FAD/NAD(P)-binding protein [Streptomyces sp. NBC_01142]MCX4827011.1 FAD/NAD(P)-binding protein [Streptomyces sp. NBC_01142]MCX4827051.1 FAD/NAD(P)-binding protein [Streptomyces sp. NBC_01142]
MNSRPLTAGGHLVVIGGGAAATAVLHQLTEHAGFRPGSVTVVDPRPAGFGVAFGTTDPKLRCNTSVDVTSLYRADRSDLQRYLAARGWPVGRADFVPRALVGQYCRERFGQLSRELQARGAQVRQVTTRARTVLPAERAGEGYRVTLDDGSTLEATDVVVAAGGDQPHLPELLRAYADHPDLLAGPYPTDRLRALPTDARVLVVGSKLSAVDAALVLCGADRQVTLCSPSGELPAVRNRLCRTARPTGLLADLRELNPGTPDFDRTLTRVLARAVRSARAGWGHPAAALRRQFGTEPKALERLTTELRQTEAGDNAWQDVIAELIEAVNDWTEGWPSAERDRLLTRFRPLIARHISAIPVSSARALAGHGLAGRLAVRRGTPAALTPDPDGGWQVRWTAAGPAEHHTHVLSASGYLRPAVCTHGPALLALGPAACSPHCAPPLTGPDLRLLRPGGADPERIWMVGAMGAARTAIVNYLWTAAGQAGTVAQALAVSTR